MNRSFAANVALRFATLFAGFVVGVLGVVGHAGPLDMPVIGLILSFVLVASGAIVVYRMSPIDLLPYTIGVFGATVWLLTSPPDNDVLVSVSSWVSNTWIVLAALATMTPVFFRRFLGGKPKTWEITAPGPIVNDDPFAQPDQAAPGYFAPQASDVEPPRP